MPGYVYLKRMVQFLQWQHRQVGAVRPRWTLKAPHHLHYLKELFEVFPGAQVVQTHREPSQSIASICSMNEKLLAMGSDEPDLQWTGDHWSSKWARALQRAMDFRDADLGDRVIDVWFLDSVRDPIGTVRKVYEHLGRELSPIAEGKMQKWTEDNAREKRAAHEYKLEDYGLSEARIHQTLGGPQPIYNGGLLHVRVRYFDAERRRPGLPEDVGALVERLSADRTVVRLVNLNPVVGRKLVIQAGAFGEHHFGDVKYQVRTSEYPGWLGGYAGTYAAPPLEVEERRATVNSSRLQVELPAGTELLLDLSTERYVNDPSCTGL